MTGMPAHGDFTRRVLIAISLVVIVALTLFVLGSAVHVFLMVFAGLLLAVLLDGVASFVSERTPFPRSLVLGATVAGLLFFGVALLWGLGPRVGAQLSEFVDLIPSAVSKAGAALREYEWSRKLLSLTIEPKELLALGGGVLRPMRGLLSGAFTGIIDLVIILVVGIYVAASPKTYVKGALRLLPVSRRARAGEVVVALTHVIRRWIAGRLASMLVVGVLTIVGLLIAGIPLALTLGLFAALATFVPYVGPAVGAIPAILVALTDEPVKALYVVLVFTIVQVLENYIITPLIDQKAVSLPPALLISAQILMGVLLGAAGVLFATPLVVVIVVLVQMLYVQDVLGDPIRVLGSIGVKRQGQDP
jgi:predicted PurR-regulated permease PerM